MKRIASIVTSAAIFLSTPMAFADSSACVPYREKVNVKVGQSIVIHALRGECGKLPTKSQVASMVKGYGDIKVGKIVAGKQGVRKSRSRGGPTPVVEAIFVAQQKGRVKIELFGDPISITVK